MEDIYLTKEEIEELERISKNYHGCNGECFKYEDGVVKIFYDGLASYLKCKIDEDIKRSSNIILWPKKRVFKVNRKTKYVIGYFMDKAPNVSLLDLKNKIISGKMDLAFDDLLRIYYDRFLKELQKEKVYMFDIKLAHVFIDDNFYFIDTDGYFDKDLYYVNTSEDKDEVKPYDYNLKEINKALALFMDCIICPGLKIYTDDDLNKESFLFDCISNIRSLTNNRVDTFMKLSNYKSR